MTSVAASSLICATTVTFVSAALSSSNAGLRRSDTIAAREVVVRRLSPIVRENIGILNIDDSRVMLWSRDLDSNGEPSSDELRMLSFESGSIIERTLPESSFPKVQYALDNDLSNIAQSMFTNPATNEVVLIQGVQALTLNSPQDNPLDSRSIMCSVVLNNLDSESADVRLHERFRMDLP
tara:strand:+ start:8144 stop:8683 length:540 start_codon:yes stop_codon:yes gene_type:complete